MSATETQIHRVPLTAAAAQLRPVASGPACRLCGSRLHHSLIDLGCQPLADRTVAAGSPDGPAYELHAFVCDTCHLVQLPDAAPAVCFTTPTPDLASGRATDLAQARRYTDAMCQRLKLNAGSLVIEIGSGDGSLLQHFQAADIAVLGIEPATTAAAAATMRGIPTEVSRFAADTAMDIAVRHGRADLVVANNVLPEVADLFDFAAGVAAILRPNGVLTLQVPHLLSLLQRTRFDAFRHDAYTYLSLQVLERLLHSVRLRIFDAERVADHDGSLRVHACHAGYPLPAKAGLKAVRLAEARAALDQSDLLTGFSARAAALRQEVRDFLQVRRGAGRLVAAYGATSQASTMLNACGFTTDEIACVADPDAAKHGRLMPGSRIPIVSLDALLEAPPNDILVLPGGDAEVAAALRPLRQRGTLFWNALPRISRL